MKYLIKLLIPIAVITLLLSCKNNRLEADISGIEIAPVKFERLDRDLFSITPQNHLTKEKELIDKYGTFYRQFVYTIINANKADTNYLLHFVTDKDMRGSYEEVQKNIKDEDISKLAEELTLCEKRFKYFFPKRKLPLKHVAYFSGYNYNIVYPDSTLGISLEMYLGNNNKYYKMLQWPQYQVRSMTKENMLPNLVRGWLITEFDNSEPTNTLLHHMIFYGKLFYTMDALLPDMHDSLKVNYSTAQMNYCEKYEKNVWGFLAQENRLYENNLKTITEFTSDGPFTGAISKDCPPRVAMWIGWQIVRSYMDNNETVSLEDLLNEKDAQKILNKSKYRP